MDEEDISSRILPEDEIIPSKKKRQFNGPRISLCMMVKNEKKRIGVTLLSCVGFVTKIIIYDTGSEDETIDIIKSFCEKYDIYLCIRYGIFVDFSTSRNKCLDFADSIDEIDFHLLLDCNDELKNGQELIKFCRNELNNENVSDPNRQSYLLQQQWWSGTITSYYNVRLLKRNSKWRYKGVVHEYIEGEEGMFTRVKIPKVIIYQDRTNDDDKTGKRFVRDRKLLIAEYKKDPKNTRTLYYLAQTCQCLKLLDEAYKYFSERLLLDGFIEEKFHAYINCGNILKEQQKQPETFLGYYIMASSILKRAEPLYKLAEYYNSVKHWEYAFMFANKACELDYPLDTTLFVDDVIYNYSRWSLLGIVSFYAGKKERGREGCQKAIEAKGLEIDINNLKFYIDEEKSSVLEKKKFVHDNRIKGGVKELMKNIKDGELNMDDINKLNIGNGKINKRLKKDLKKYTGMLSNSNALK